MLPCNGCAYRREIPGNAHIRCVFRWDRIHYEPRRWFIFPYNYDPLWGPDECAARAETADPEKVMPDSPVADLLSLLAERWG